MMRCPFADSAPLPRPRTQITRTTTPVLATGSSPSLPPLPLCRPSPARCRSSVRVYLSSHQVRTSEGGPQCRCFRASSATSHRRRLHLSVLLNLACPRPLIPPPRAAGPAAEAVVAALQPRDAGGRRTGSRARRSPRPPRPAAASTPSAPCLCSSRSSHHSLPSTITPPQVHRWHSANPHRSLFRTCRTVPPPQAPPQSSRPPPLRKRASSPSLHPRSAACRHLRVFPWAPR
jgi:hypothetical protein